MNKIINWTFGSVFRTFGRIIAYILVGVLFSYILSKTGFKISDLFLDNVKASTWQQSVVNWQDNNGNNLPQYYGQYRDFNYNTNYTNSQFVIQNGATLPSGTRGVLFSVVFRFFQFQQYLECYQYSTTSGSNQVCDKYTFNGHQNVSFSMYYNNNYNVFNCYWYDNTFTTTLDSNFVKGLLYCPVPTGLQYNNINSLSYQGNVSRQQNISATDYPTYSIGLEKTIFFDIDTQQGTTDAIDNQTQQQQQQHDEIMDTNSTTTESSANDLFSNEVFEDSGGLSSIITAPLVMINQMLSNTCVSPSATWKGATISLPCGSMLWDRPNASQLKDLLNVFYGGFVCYYAIRKLFLMIEKMKDPTSDNIEVTDL